MFTGSTPPHASLNSVQLQPLGHLNLLTGGSIFKSQGFLKKENLVSIPMLFSKSLVKKFSRYDSSTLVQIPSERCPVCCHRWNPQNILLLRTPPRHWTYPSLGCVYHSLSTKTGSLNVEASLVTLSTRPSRAGQCLACKTNLSCAPALPDLKSPCCHDRS